MVHCPLLTTRGRYGALHSIDHQGALWSLMLYRTQWGAMGHCIQLTTRGRYGAQCPIDAMVHCPLLTTRGRYGAVSY